MNTHSLHTALDELEVAISNGSPALQALGRIHEKLPSMMSPELIAELGARPGLKQPIIGIFLNDCRYMIRIYAYAGGSFIAEEYSKLVQVTTNLLLVEPLLENEPVFTEFKEALTTSLKGHKSFRSGFRAAYFSLSNTNRSHTLEALL